jgi:hypothetical protein
METINNIQKYVQSHKVDNERLRTNKEQEVEFNIKMLQNLNNIERKMDKESKYITENEPKSRKKEVRCGVIIAIIDTLLNTHLGGHPVAQDCPMLENVRGEVEKMS